MGDVRFRVLGPVLVERDGVPIALPIKQRTLLAVLLLRAGDPISVSDQDRGRRGPGPGRTQRALGEIQAGDD